MQGAVISPRTIVSVSPASGCGTASGKYFESDGCTSASISITRSTHVGQQRAQVRRERRLSDATLRARDGNLINDSAPDSGHSSGIRIRVKKCRLRLQVLAKPLIDKDPSNALDLLVQGAAWDSEPLEASLIEHPSSPTIRHNCCCSGVSRTNTRAISMRAWSRSPPPDSPDCADSRSRRARRPRPRRLPDPSSGASSESRSCITRALVGRLFA